MKKQEKQLNTIKNYDGQMGKIPDKIKQQIDYKPIRPQIPKEEGIFVKTKDTLRLSPRNFLRIGKVQKHHEEPLTEAQVKHRDRSHVIHKLNQQVQIMKKKENKDIKRDDYLSLYEKTVSQKQSEKQKEFTQAATD